MNRPIRLASPYRTVAAPPWTDTIFDDWTGVITYLLRAVAADGKEEGNIREVLVLPVQNGVVGVALPAEPRIVEARAIAGGRIELEWLYDPAYEYRGPGAAHRIYWDAGIGTVDFTAPHATVPMNQPMKATRYTWQSAPPHGRSDLPLHHPHRHRLLARRPRNPEHRLPARHGRLICSRHTHADCQSEVMRPVAKQQEHLHSSPPRRTARIYSSLPGHSQVSALSASR